MRLGTVKHFSQLCELLLDYFDNFANLQIAKDLWLDEVLGKFLKQSLVCLSRAHSYHSMDALPLDSCPW